MKTRAQIRNSNTASYFVEQVQFFKKYGFPTARAFALARAENRAEPAGFAVNWELDPEPWQGDCEEPAIHAWAGVVVPEISFLNGALPSLGGIGLNSWSDPYVRVVEAELLEEALDILEKRKKAALVARILEAVA